MSPTTCKIQGKVTVAIIQSACETNAKMLKRGET